MVLLNNYYIMLKHIVDYRKLHFNNLLKTNIDFRILQKPQIILKYNKHTDCLMKNIKDYNY